GAERFEADHFLIATGSRPRQPTGIEADGERGVTSDPIEAWRTFPRSMVIVGPGVIGCEYAAIFGHYPRTAIHLIDQQPRILPFEDDDVAGLIAERYRSMGITVHHEARLQTLRVVDGEVEFTVSDAGGARPPIQVERALISIGRVPNTTGLGLE